MRSLRERRSAHEPSSELFRAHDRQQSSGSLSALPTHKKHRIPTFGSLRFVHCDLRHVFAGLVCGLLLFVFCCVYASMIFQQPDLPAALEAIVPLGVGMHTFSMMSGSLMFAWRSGCKASIAGPDLNAVVFIAEATWAIANAVCPSGSVEAEASSSSGSSSRPSSSGRRLGGSQGSGRECPSDVADVLVPTVLAGCMIASLLVGLSFVLIGVCRLTGVVGFVPANVTAGFLSCVGWKVIKASLKVASGNPLKLFKADGAYLVDLFGSWDSSWRLLLPGIPIGLLLYFCKRWHISSPSITFPVLIGAPTALFYIIIFASGHTMSSMRELGWLNPQSNSEWPEGYAFYDQWVVFYSGLANDKIDWAALAAGVPSWAIMILIVCLDHMLMLAYTETALKIELDYNREMIVGGAASILNGLLTASPAYAQTKFTVLNYSFASRTDSAIPSLVTAAFGGALFFSGVPVIDFLPRFLLAGLLIYSGSGFLIENLWDARNLYDRFSFGSIWAVFIINVIAGELLPQYGLLIAFVVGIVLSAFGFAFKFAQTSKLADSVPGYDYSSTAIRSAAQEMKLGVLGCWYHIFPCSGYMFFGTSALLYNKFKSHVVDLQRLPRYERTKFIIFDMCAVNETDETALNVFKKVKRLATSHHITIVWCGLNDKIKKRFEVHGVLDHSLKDHSLRDHDGALRGSRHDGAHMFQTMAAGVGAVVHQDLDTAVKVVEDLLLQHVHNLAQRWLVHPDARKIWIRTMLHDSVTATTAVSDGGIGPNQLLRWADKCVVPRKTAVFLEGDYDDGLYLLYQGKVITASENPPARTTVYPGAFFNESVLLRSEGTGGTLYTATAEEDSVILCLSHSQRQAMQWAEPHLAYNLVLAVFRQAEMRQPHFRHAKHNAPMNAPALPAPLRRKRTPPWKQRRAAEHDAQHDASSPDGYSPGSRGVNGSTPGSTDTSTSSSHMELDEGGGGSPGSSRQSSPCVAATPSAPMTALMTAPSPQLQHSPVLSFLSSLCDGVFSTSASGSATGQPPSSPEPLAHAEEGKGGRAHFGAHFGNLGESGGGSRVAASLPMVAGAEASRKIGHQSMCQSTAECAQPLSSWARVRTHKVQRHFSPEVASTHGHQPSVASTNERQAQRKAAHATRKAKDTNFKSFLEVIQAAIDAAQETEALPAPVREMTNRLTRAVTRGLSGLGLVAPSSNEGQAVDDAQSCGRRRRPSNEGQAIDGVVGTLGRVGSGLHRSLTAATRTRLSDASSGSSHSLTEEGARERLKLDGRHHGQRSARHAALFDKQFLDEHEYKAPLTRKQREHYQLIFRLNDHSSSAGGDDEERGRLKITELSRYMESLGHAVPLAELVAMMNEEGITHAAEDAELSLEDFLEFIRRSIVSDLPAKKMPYVEKLFQRYAHNPSDARTRGQTRSHTAEDATTPHGQTKTLAKTLFASPAARSSTATSSEAPPEELPDRQHQTASHPLFGMFESRSGKRSAVGAALGGTRGAFGAALAAGGPEFAEPRVHKSDAEAMLRELGCELDEYTFTEIFDEVDSDGSGYLQYDELVTALGMIKRNVVEVMKLEQAFTKLRSLERLKELKADPKHKRRHAHAVYASDLVHTLKISEVEAEEMIFIADLKDEDATLEKSIDFSEFKQVVVNWSN